MMYNVLQSVPFGGLHQPHHHHGKVRGVSPKGDIKGQKSQNWGCDIIYECLNE